jgi:Spy/CpxP family protein refolding chaperone
MKKTLVIGGLVLVMVLAALPILAQQAQPPAAPGPQGGPGWGPGYGPGYHMGPGGWANLDPEKVKAFQAAQQKFRTETLDLRQKMALKGAELKALVLNPEAKQEAILAKHKELQALKSQFSEKRLLHLIEMKKQFPELGAGMVGRGPHGGRMVGGMRGGMGPGMGPGMAF